MSEDYKRIASLIMKVRRNAANAEEMAELTAWSEKSPANQQLIKDFMNDEWVSREMMSFQNLDWKGHWHNLTRNIPVLQTIRMDRIPMILEDLPEDAMMKKMNGTDQEMEWIPVEARTPRFFYQRRWFWMVMILTKLTLIWMIWRVWHRQH